MNLQPKIPNRSNEQKFCPCCQQPRPITQFIRVKSPASLDGYTEKCGLCIENELRSIGYAWDILDQYCQYCNIPWIPDKFEETKEVVKTQPFLQYAQIFNEAQYEKLNWKEYYQEFKALESENKIDQELPLLRDDEIKHLQSKWGANYSEEQLYYLDNLFTGLMLSQNVNGDLSKDQAKKLCKFSLEIDERIRAGQECDKILSSYEKLIKITEFTPRNTKNAADFDSTGELFHWLEKRGWVNKYYDDVPKDVVDETMRNIQNINQKLYTHESGIGEEITRRIEALKAADKLENFYDVESSDNLDDYDAQGYDDLLGDESFKEEV